MSGIRDLHVIVSVIYIDPLRGQFILCANLEIQVNLKPIERAGN